jgi:DNA polymerase III epsilon subunit family exonuclease
MSDSPWLELEKELNTGQREAVFTRAPHSLVLAGPGTGKTRTLVNRIVYLVTIEEVAPESILALTFTRKAASVMTARLVPYLGERAGDIQAGTFHHFCLHLLRQAAGRCGIPDDFSVADEHRQVQVLKRAWNRLGFSKREAEAKELRMLLGRFADYRVERTPDRLSALQRELFTEYQRLLRKEQAIDFDDILDLSYNLLNTDQDLLDASRRQWTRVLVDEFQDTDALQYRLLRLLVPLDGSSFLVADDQQSIYAWRGADRRNIENYRRDYQPVEICLGENYRNAGAILTGAQALLAGGGDSPRQLESRTGQEGIFQIESFATEQEEAHFLVADIKRARLKEPDLRWRDIAVLYPKHSIGEYLETGLMGERIPVELVSGRALLEQPRIRALLAHLRLQRNPKDEGALETLVEEHLDDGSRALFRRCTGPRGGSTRATLDFLIRSRGTLSGLRKSWDHFRNSCPDPDDDQFLSACLKQWPRGLGLEPFLGDTVNRSSDDRQGAPAGDAPDFEYQGQILTQLSRLPWSLEGLVATISNLKAGGEGRTLGQLVREILLEIGEDDHCEIPGDPAGVNGLDEILTTMRGLLKSGRCVQVVGAGERQSELLAAMLRDGLEPWLAQNIVVDKTRSPAARLVADATSGELRLEGEEKLTVNGGGSDTQAAQLIFRLCQLWRSSDYRGLRDYVIFDLETTGVDIRSCEVVEIAAIRFENGKEVDRFETLVGTERPIPPGATAVHGITDKMVAQAPPVVQALKSFLEFIGDRDLVAHNGVGFDYPIIRRLTREHRLPRPTNALFDTLALARRLFPGERVSLEKLIHRFGVEAQARHRAMDDCRCLGEVLTGMQELQLDRLRCRTGTEALAPLALALYLNPGGPPAPAAGVTHQLFRLGVRRLLASGSRWLEQFEPEGERKTLEEALVEAAGLEIEAPDLFSGLRSEEERFLALLPRFDELFLGDSLAGFLDFLTLYQAPDLAGAQEAVQLMTIHSAKGLEFKRVYIVGLEENVLPGYYALRTDDPESIEEERRLLYVAMTRAASSLIMTRVDSRGGFQQAPSRFLTCFEAAGGDR